MLFRLIKLSHAGITATAHVVPISLSVYVDIKNADLRQRSSCRLMVLNIANVTHFGIKTIFLAENFAVGRIFLTFGHV